MYTRSYGERASLPENYDGTAFSQPEPAEYERNEAHAIPASCGECNVGHGRGGSSGLSRLPFFGDLFGGGIGGLFSSIGTEELLIIGIALFLIFSGDGDTECALMLLLLLFIR